MRLVSAICCILFSAVGVTAQPLQLLPENPHYFQYDGKPTLLVGSGEHYGAVVNLDFDYKTYLATLAADGLNNTRLFTGAYVEKQGDFGIQKNTLAPRSGRLILPWARSEQSGYALGGNKFDLSRWDEAYFERLRDFMSRAQQLGIIVEVTLFSSYYGTGWPYSPFNPANNINQTDAIRPLQANTLQNGNLLKYQEQYVRKLVRELNSFRNLYYEIQNEPWADLKDTVLTRNEYHTSPDGKRDWRATLEVSSQASLQWQRRVASWIVSEEENLLQNHLISQNVSNFRYPILDLDPNVSIYTFHYALPEAVTDNYALNRVIGFNETGFAGQADRTYRRQAWRFLMAGGGLFNHLDYSFSVGGEIGQDTTYRRSTTPGGGSPALRRQLGAMKRYLDRFDLTQLSPDPTFVKASPGAVTQTLKNGKNGWLIYAEPFSPNSFLLQVNLPKGDYHAEWADAETGQVLKSGSAEPSGSLAAPPGTRDLILRIIKF
ncbi:hypothetical protein [Spirosoma sp. 209]|uniref:hypothetical protein n=1 Tax=Spirosoma sp. 209 TaxID=1955701 RepID=UPI00098D1F58|nr:hypothetical protein [Spirosoma sp. 209]